MIDLILFIAYFAVFYCGLIVGGTYGGVKGVINECKRKVREWTA